MTRLLATPRFPFDINEVLNYLENVAGPRVAAKYGSRFDETIVRLLTISPNPELRGLHWE